MIPSRKQYMDQIIEDLTSLGFRHDIDSVSYGCSHVFFDRDDNIIMIDDFMDPDTADYYYNIHIKRNGEWDIEDLEVNKYEDLIGIYKSKLSDIIRDKKITQLGI